MAITYSGFAGDLLEITCTITGPSLPSFEWRNESKILSLTTRVKIENNDQVSKLSVRKTAKSDSGSYHCIARLVHFIFTVACRTTISAMKLTICHVAISFCIISLNLFTYFSKGEDTINKSVIIDVKVIPMVLVSPPSVSVTEGITTLAVFILETDNSSGRT